MKKAIVLIAMTTLLAISSTAGAAEKTADGSNTVEITTSDGVLSIEMSGDEWEEKEGSDSWFEITDGRNSIVIDHLSYGEDLPDVKMADDEYEGVYQTFISTKNEVFIITGLADSRESLDDVMQAAGTIRILKYDTKTAVQEDTQSAQTAQAAQPGITAVNATYYVTADELNVRSDHSADSEVLGALYKGEAVTVTGTVTQDGVDTGWYQIRYKDKIGYVSSSFLSQAAPAGTAGGTDQSGQSGGTDQSGQSGQSENSGKIQCERCGQWFSPDELRDHQLGHTMDDLYGDKVQCERCGEWFSPDELRDHQLGHTMDDMNAGN